MSRCIGCVYKHSHLSWPYISPNTTFFASSCSVNTTTQITTGGNSAAPENLIQTKPFSILNSTNRLDIILKHQSTNSTPYTFSRSIISTGLTHTNLNPPKFISCLTAIVRPNKGCVHEAFHWSVE